ncbi:MAG: tRNA (guanosine(37)-N1)-methyltransferase TrmD [Elusimicrobia bacterium]|nr:tRNA (guanosine(37)-N1)-methyltransferase TrmD [Elusimicrobiota bacterium]
MQIDIITLFPEMFQGPFDWSILKKAQQKEALKINFVNPRDFTEDAHRTVDDRPYGGGKGMLLKAEPLFRAVRQVKKKSSWVVYLSPKGKPLEQSQVKKLSQKQHLILVCGHYEGVDERFLKGVDLVLSIGDYVLTGGEIPAMVLVDAVARLLPGVLDVEATREESFAAKRLESPHFTRPQVWRGRRVPSLLLNGDHQEIATWRESQSLKLTKSLRPDLLTKTKRIQEAKSKSISV